MTAKIEPWITETAAYIQAVYNLLPEAVPCITKIIANDIAAHAPQEPSVPVRTLKAYRDKICRRWLEINLPETSIALSVIGDELLQLIDQAKPSA